MLTFDFKTYMGSVITKDQFKKYLPRLQKITNHMNRKLEMLDWLDVSTSITKEELERLKSLAQYTKSHCDLFIVIGIGGSYLGSKAVIDAIHPYFGSDGLHPEVIYLGTSLSSSYIKDLIGWIGEKDVIVNVISKSGNTLEPNIAFTIFQKYLRRRYGKEELEHRLIITTDESSGSLLEFAKKHHLNTLSIPKNIGGRFSIFTAAGLFPMAVAGIQIDLLLKGAKQGKNYLNEAYMYAMVRDILRKEGRQIESFTVYEPKLAYFTEWLKQLMMETQGKNKKGLLTTSAINTRDLHSLGQYYQEGTDNLFETVIAIEKTTKVTVPRYEKTLDEINLIAAKAVASAHKKGNTPSSMIIMDKLNEKNLGSLCYFFMMSAAIGAYLLGVDPFNQPGVEVYKKGIKGSLK